MQRFEIFRDHVPFEMVAASTEEVLEAARYTELKDAPIVAAAKKAEVDYLITLDRRHLLQPPDVALKSGLNITLPVELLHKIRREMEND